MAATGTSPAYFDFDAFDEISVSTGGNDLRAATGGIGLNFVTRRGTNAFHGSVHGYFTHHDAAGLEHRRRPRSPPTPGCMARPDGTFSDKADHIDQIANYGADSAARSSRTGSGSGAPTAGRTSATSASTRPRTARPEELQREGELAGRRRDMLSLFYFLGVKEKYRPQAGLGRRRTGLVPLEPGQQVRRQPAARSVQDRRQPRLRPQPLPEREVRLLQHGLRLRSRRAARISPAESTSDSDGGGLLHPYTAIRPQHTASLDGNAFFSGLGGSHELKFGFGYRRTYGPLHHGL